VPIISYDGGHPTLKVPKAFRFQCSREFKVGKLPDFVYKVFLRDKVEINS